MKIVLDDVIELINTLRTRIEQNRDKLSKNEALVRSSLIEPFLRVLGWDTSDPSQIVPEFTTEVGRPDYAMFIKGDDKPKAFLGAKKLGKQEDLTQYITYCVSKGVDYFIATDGENWDVYETFKKTDISNKKIIEWNISEDEPSQIAIKSLTIANLQSFGTLAFQNTTPIFSTVIQKNETDKDNKNEKGKRRKILRPEILYINGLKIEINKSREILINTAEWLIKEGKLTKNKVPISSGPDRYIINIEPIHKNRKNFFDPYKLSNGLYMEMHASSKRLENLAKKLMEYFGYDKKSLRVQWKKIN